MSLRTFFPAESWIDKVVEFEEGNDGVFSCKQWQIVKMRNERDDQGSKAEWEAFEQQPMKAVAMFDCRNKNDPSQSALIKVYMQIPYAGSEFASPTVRAAQASPDAEIREEIALSALTQKGCKSTPRFLNSRRSIQDSSDLVPGGFIVYLVTEVPPGDLLKENVYWKLTYKERAEIRLAFKAAYEDCLGCGFVYLKAFLGTSLLWDKTGQRIFILGVEDAEPATADDAWNDMMWAVWGFCRPVHDLHRQEGPLQPNMMRDDSLNKTV